MQRKRQSLRELCVIEGEVAMFKEDVLKDSRMLQLLGEPKGEGLAEEETVWGSIPSVPVTMPALMTSTQHRTGRKRFFGLIAFQVYQIHRGGEIVLGFLAVGMCARLVYGSRSGSRESRARSRSSHYSFQRSAPNDRLLPPITFKASTRNMRGWALICNPR